MSILRADIENAMANIIANWSSRIIPDNLLIGELPLTDEMDIVAVQIASESFSEVDQIDCVKSYLVEVSGRFKTRAETLAFLDIIEENTPIYGVVDSYLDKDVYINMIERSTVNAPIRTKNDGIDCYIASVILKIVATTIK